MSDQKELLLQVKSSQKGILLALLVGVAAFFLHGISKIPLLDPLFVAMSLGIIFRAVKPFSEQTIKGFEIVPAFLIPPGVAIYGAVSLRFKEVALIEELDFVLMALLVFIIYIISALILSKIFRLTEKSGYLVAAGSAICGASAIAITSQSIDAEADEISVSLIAVFISGLIGLFLFIPLITHFFGLPSMITGAFSGTVLQFTGFVKVAAAQLDVGAGKMALSVKALRYMGLLFIIPMFSSFVKGRFYIPWYLWSFLIAGVLFESFPVLAKMRPFFRPVLDMMWSVAMAAIGLSADFRKVVSLNGARTLAVSILSFLIASGFFLWTCYVFLSDFSF